MNSIYHVLSSTVIYHAFRYAGSSIHLMVKQKKLRKASQDPEANPSRDTLFPKTKAHEIRGTQRDIDDSAYVFIVNICFAFAGFANFFSLLDFGNQSVNVGCSAYG